MQIQIHQDQVTFHMRGINIKSSTTMRCRCRIMVTRGFNAIYGCDIFNFMFGYTNDMKFVFNDRPDFFEIIMIFIYGSQIGAKYAYRRGIWLQLI